MMTNKNSYLIKLRPVGHYFFGSENTFSTTDKADTKKTITNYFVRSRAFPQQTTLLGILRYALLLKFKMLNESYDKKSELIGENSFHGSSTSITKWGIINKISPLFLMKDEKKFTIAGIDFQYYSKDNTEELINLQPTTSYNDNFTSANDPNLLFINYDPKQTHQLLWKEVGSENIFLRPSDIFNVSSQVGIRKSFTGKSLNDSFYKQVFTSLNEGFSFAFYADLDTELTNIPSSMVLPAGSDQSIFNLQFLKEDSFFVDPLISDNWVKITLLSDAYLNPEILSDCPLAITNIVDFRYIKTSVYTKRYHNIGKRSGDASKSIKHNLVERGSVLITNKPNKIITALTEPTSFRHAGFNHFSVKSINIK